MKGLQLWDTVSKKMVINKNVIFDEQFMLEQLVVVDMKGGTSKNEVIHKDIDPLLVSNM